MRDFALGLLVLDKVFEIWMGLHNSKRKSTGETWCALEQIIPLRAYFSSNENNTIISYVSLEQPFQRKKKMHCEISTSINGAKEQKWISLTSSSQMRVHPAFLSRVYRNRPQHGSDPAVTPQLSSRRKATLPDTTTPREPLSESFCLNRLFCSDSYEPIRKVRVNHWNHNPSRNQITTSI